MSHLPIPRLVSTINFLPHKRHQQTQTLLARLQVPRKQGQSQSRHTIGLHLPTRFLQREVNAIPFHHCRMPQRMTRLQQNL